MIFSRSDLGLGIVEYLLHEKTLGLVLGQARSSKKEMGSHNFQIWTKSLQKSPKSEQIP